MTELTFLMMEEMNSWKYHTPLRRHIEGMGILTSNDSSHMTRVILGHPSSTSHRKEDNGGPGKRIVSYERSYPLILRHHEWG
jgi:hypothetical protein